MSGMETSEKRLLFIEEPAPDPENWLQAFQFPSRLHDEVVRVCKEEFLDASSFAHMDDELFEMLERERAVGVVSALRQIRAKMKKQ